MAEENFCAIEDYVEDLSDTLKKFADAVQGCIENLEERVEKIEGDLEDSGRCFESIIEKFETVEKHVQDLEVRADEFEAMKTRFEELEKRVEFQDKLIEGLFYRAMINKSMTCGNSIQTYIISKDLGYKGEEMAKQLKVEKADGTFDKVLATKIVSFTDILIKEGAFKKWREEVKAGIHDD